ncbi:MAG TPA: glycosyltransferase family 39 protein, partial [Gemmataceae bacterium]|nr:glycosyltransferase family 39 protein [Gemmataceae bacterium]
MSTAPAERHGGGQECSVRRAPCSVRDAEPSARGASRPPSSRPALPLVHLSVLAALCAFLFFLRLPDRDLWSSHEARAAQNAQAILDDGNWALPRLYDGRPELQKPPLYYWLVAATGWCNGGRVEGWAVRLPAALSATACVLGLWLLAWRRGRPVAGLVAAAALATAVHFTWLARVGRIDMPLTLAVGVAVAALCLASRGRQPPEER